jgi:hypothetical protein
MAFSESMQLQSNHTQCFISIILCIASKVKSLYTCFCKHKAQKSQFKYILSITMSFGKNISFTFSEKHFCIKIYKW